jgi:hypothetical protein
MLTQRAPLFTKTRVHSAAGQPWSVAVPQLFETTFDRRMRWLTTLGTLKHQLSDRVCNRAVSGGPEAASTPAAGAGAPRPQLAAADVVLGMLLSGAILSPLRSVQSVAGRTPDAAFIVSEAQEA